LLFVAIPLTLLLTALSAALITRVAFRPMSAMVETTRRITAANLSERLSLPRAKDEVRHLGETLNDMIERIDGAFRSQKQFIADASHEIRTPLTIICNELEFALRKTGDPALQESIRTSLEEVDRLARLTDQLLLLARIDADQLVLRPDTFRLDELLLECVQRISSVAHAKRVTLNAEIDNPIEIHADREKLKSVILNLLENAVKYSNPDSTVCASVRVPGDSTSTVLLAVRDQGPGIPAHELTHIFRRFYRADTARSENEGSGLGLAIVERLVMLHNGRVGVTSEPGKGTTFTVEMPLTRHP